MTLTQSSSTLNNTSVGIVTSSAQSKDGKYIYFSTDSGFLIEFDTTTTTTTNKLKTLLTQIYVDHLAVIPNGFIGVNKSGIFYEMIKENEIFFVREIIIIFLFLLRIFFTSPSASAFSARARVLLPPLRLN